MISLEKRQKIVAMIEQARREGARLKAACEVGGIDARTLQRWEANDGLQDGDRRPGAMRPLPAHASSTQERENSANLQRAALCGSAASAHRAHVGRRGGLYCQRIQLQPCAASSWSNSSQRTRQDSSTGATANHPCRYRAPPGVDVGHDFFADSGGRSLVLLVSDP